MWKGFSLCLCLAGCVPGPATPPEAWVPPPAPGSCGAADLQHLIGQPDTTLATLRFNQPVRLLRPGIAVTMDYSAERLNIKINEAGVITGLTCG